MRKTLSIDILKLNLVWIYEKYNKIYDKKYKYDAFNHVKFKLNIFILLKNIN